MLGFAPPRAQRPAALLAAAALTAATAGSAAPRAVPPLPPTVAASAPASKPPAYYNGVQDTGQFLPDSAVLARVDGRRFTVRDFLVEYFSTFGGDRPRPDSLGRVKFLGTLIDKQVLGQAARKVGYNIGYEGRVEMRDYTERILANQLFRRLVIDSATVSEEDVQRVYSQYKLTLRIHRILFVDLATAERVRADLIAGRISWGAAVKKYTRATEDHEDGDIGWVTRGKLSIAIAEEVYAVRPGQFSQVVEDAKGFQLLKVVDERAVSPPPLSSLERVIRGQLLNYRIDVGAGRVQTLVAAHMGMVPDSANIAWACRLFPRSVNVEHPDEGGTTLRVNDVLPEVSGADTSRILARWKGGSISLGRFLAEYGEISPISRPNVDTPQGMTTMVENIASEPYKAQMAVDRGFDKDAAVIEQIESHHEKLLVQRMYGDSVDAHVTVSFAERRAEYAAHPDRYSVPETRRFAVIPRASQAAADSLAAALRAGTSATAVLAADSAAGRSGGAVQSLSADEHGPFKKIVFEELKVGQVTTAVAANGRPAAVQLLEVAPPRKRSYEEVETDLDANLRAEKSEQLLQAWLARLKKQHSIEARPDLVMRIRLQEPGT